MKINIDKKVITEFLTHLLNIPSPTGDTEKAVLFVESRFKELGLECSRTKKGNLIGTIKGVSDRAITFSGHVDTLGLMVKEIKSNGRLLVTQIGGFAMNTVDGNYVKISTEKNGLIDGTVMFDKISVHSYRDVSTVERTLDNMEVRIDEKVESIEDVTKLGVQVGDFIYLDPGVMAFENGYIKSRHLDDKAGVAAMYGIAKYLKDNNITPNYTVHFLISTFEEVGHGSSSGIPATTDYFIAVDMAAMGDSQTSTEHATTICVKDSSGPYDINVKRKLVDAGIKYDVDYKLDIYKYYGSDASAMVRAGYDIPTGLIGPGVDASHAFERTHIDGILNTSVIGIGFIELV